MAVYSVEGKLGTGKTKFTVWRAQLALFEGRRVASNVDLKLGALCRGRAARYMRIPDKPTSFDLAAIGHGNPESYDEEKNGVLILDELATWLNARSFQDPDRRGVIDWLIHARKLGWDVYLIVQDSGMIDKQVRESLIEYQCRCVRLDKMKLPILGWMLGFFANLVEAVSWELSQRLNTKRWGYMPRCHVVAARVGYGAGSIVAERWMYRGDDLHAAYDTRQVFTADYPHGVHTVIYHPPPPKPSRWAQLRALFAPRPRPQLRPKLPRVAALAAEPRDLAWAAARDLARSS